MTATTILPFAGTSTTILSNSAYAADAQRLIGNQPGTARAELVNKAMLQSSVMAAAVAKFMATYQPHDINDNETVVNLATWFADALVTAVAAAGGAFDFTQNSQSGTYEFTRADSFGGSVYHPAADTSGRTWTIPHIPADTPGVPYPKGAVLHVVVHPGAGPITLTAAGGDTIYWAGPGTIGDRIVTSGTATLEKMENDHWMLAGIGVT